MDESTGGGQPDGLAPVIPLFGRSLAEARSSGVDHPGRADHDAVGNGTEARPDGRRPVAGSWHTTWTGDAGDEPTGRDREDPDPEDSGAREAAEAGLLKRLRTRSLSVREARESLVAAGLDADAAEAVIDRCLRHGYLDDARLAEQVVFSGAERKGQGRHAIAQTLAKRGIPRELAEAALADTEDDDAQRALEYARHKARAFRDVDRETALRRLVGQLSRRGYPGQVAMSAARTALDECDAPRARVRFEP